VPQVFDRETGTPVDVSPEDAAAGLVSGQYAVNANAGAVPIADKSGAIFKADPDHLANALATGKFRLLNPQEELEHRVAKEEKEKGVLGSLNEAGKSFINQAAFGIPGALQEAAESPEDKAEREAREKYHSFGRHLAGAAGVVASMAYGGELFKGAELAGQAVERGILPAAEAAQAGLARTLAAKSANMAAQGAAFASPQALIEGAVGGDWKKAGETLAWGVGTGAALGGVGELLRAGGSAALGKLAEVGGEGGLADDLAQKLTPKAFGAQKSQLTPLKREWREEVVDFAHEEGLIQPGMSRVDLGVSVKAAKEKYGQKIGDTIEKLDDLIARGTAEEDLPSHAIKPGEIGDAIKTALDDPKLRMDMNFDQANALDMVIRSANKMKTTFVNGREVVDFKTAQDFVSDLRRKWVGPINKAMNEGGLKGQRAVTPLDEMKAAAYESARNALHSAADRVASASKDPSLAMDLVGAKKAFAKVMELESWTNNLEAQQVGNRKIGLTDFLHMGHGIPSSILGAAGAGLGGLVGGPAGAMIGAAAMKVPGIALDYLAKHWMEDKGLVYLSTIAKKAAREGPEFFAAVMTSEGIKRLDASMGDVRNTVKQLAVRGVEETKAHKQEHMKALLGDTTGLSKDQQFDKLSNRLTALAANPGALAQVTGALSAPFAAASPELGRAYQQQVAQTVSYLYNALPKPDAPPMPFAPNDFEPTAQQKLDFHDKAEIASNPMAAMKHVAQGTLSDSHLDALRTLYPAVYGQMQQEVLRFHAEHPNAKLPLAERASVGKFLGASTDVLQTTEALRVIQEQYLQTHPQPQGAPGPGRMPKGKLKHLPSTQSTFASTMGPAPSGAA
jgi:hypothetical protein